MDDEETKKNVVHSVYVYCPVSNSFWYSFKVMGVRLKVETIYVR